MTTTKTFDGFKKTGIDSSIEQAIEEHCDKYEISPGEAVKLFPVLIRRQMLKRFLAHHELFLKTLDVPGDIAELGVFRGLGLLTWANLLEIYCIGDRTKTVWGFKTGKDLLILPKKMIVSFLKHINIKVVFLRLLFTKSSSQQLRSLIKTALSLGNLAFS